MVTIDRIRKINSFSNTILPQKQDSPYKINFNKNFSTAGQIVYII